MLEVAPDASGDEIKRAFRREIAKYHPDKVQHLGKEFQDIAAVKAAELTQAYKTLTDATLREEYDAFVSTEGTASTSCRHSVRRARGNAAAAAGRAAASAPAIGITVFSRAGWRE